MNNSTEYVIERLRRTLHEDARTAELGIEVTVEGLVVSLGGRVNSARGRDHIEQVVREALPGYVVHNRIQVLPPTPPRVVEALGE